MIIAIVTRTEKRARLRDKVAIFRFCRRGHGQRRFAVGGHVQFVRRSLPGVNSIARK